MEEEKLEGLDGWLILVGIGIVIGPIRMLVTGVPIYLPLLEPEVWTALTSPASEAYIPNIGWLLILEIVVNVGLLVIAIYMAYLFFKKHRLFPKIYIGLAVFSTTFILLDARLGAKLLPGVEMLDAETLSELARSMIALLIWTPYMLISKRVKQTFIHPVAA